MFVCTYSMYMLYTHRHTHHAHSPHSILYSSKRKQIHFIEESWFACDVRSSVRSLARSPAHSLACLLRRARLTLYMFAVLHVNVSRFHCVFCALFKISFLLFFEVAVVNFLFCRRALFSEVFVVFLFLTSFLRLLCSWIAS